MTTMMVTMHRAFAARAQVDAIAAVPTSSSSNTAPLLAVAQSHLEGNQWGGIVSLYDAATGEQQCAFQLAAGVSSLAWCGADRELLALACDNGDVQLVQLARLDGDIAFAPQSGSATSTSSEPVDDDDSATSAHAHAHAHAPTSFGHDDVVTCVSASQLESSRIATSSWDLTVKLWDVSRLDKTVATLEGHTDLVWSVALNPLAAHVLASASQDCTVQLWDARQPTDAVQALAVPSAALALDWHPTRETLFSVGLEDGSVLTFDTRSAGAALLDATPHTGAVHALKYSRVHADLLASGGDDAMVFTRNGAQPAQRIAPAGTSTTSNNNGSGSNDDMASKHTRHCDYVRALEWVDASSSAFGGDGSSSDASASVLATGCWDQTVRTWRVEQQ